jgi:hypothetical protein
MALTMTMGTLAKATTTMTTTMGTRPMAKTMCQTR